MRCTAQLQAAAKYPQPPHKQEQGTTAEQVSEHHCMQLGCRFRMSHSFLALTFSFTSHIIENPTSPPSPTTWTDRKMHSLLRSSARNATLSTATGSVSVPTIELNTMRTFGQGRRSTASKDSIRNQEHTSSFPERIREHVIPSHFWSSACHVYPSAT